MPIQWLSFPLYVKWYITGKCNLRCKHCYLTDYTVQQPFSEIRKFIDYFGENGVSGIAFLGGEPLVREDFEEILCLLKKYNITSKVATNGTLITRERAKDLVNSGCKFYQISLEGHSPEHSDPVRGRSTFEKALTGARNLKDQGAWVSLGVTISKQNAPHIFEIHQLARDVGVDQLKLGAFIPVGTGKLHDNIFSLNREIVSDVRNNLLVLKEQYPEIEIDSRFLPQKYTYCESDFTYGCGAGTTNLVLNSDLTISACDMLVEEDRTKIPVKNPEEIEYIWNNDPLFNKWRGLSPNEQTKTINNFKKVHYANCHVAYSAYEEDLFRD